MALTDPPHHAPGATEKQVGIRHDIFSVKFQGLDARLSGVENPKVITKILG